jgi:hypothetical protein
MWFESRVIIIHQKSAVIFNIILHLKWSWYFWNHTWMTQTLIKKLVSWCLMNAVEIYIVMLMRLDCNGYEKTSLVRQLKIQVQHSSFQLGNSEELHYFILICGKNYLNIQPSGLTRILLCLWNCSSTEGYVW